MTGRKVMRVLITALVLLAFACDCAAGPPPGKAGTKDKAHGNDIADIRKRLGNTELKPKPSPRLGPGDGKNGTNAAASKNNNNNNNNNTRHGNIQDRRPQHLGPMSGLKFNITNRLAARRYEKNFNFTKHNMHLLFDDRNRTNTTVGGGRGDSSAPIGALNHTNTNAIVGRGKAEPAAKATANNTKKTGSGGTNDNNSSSNSSSTSVAVKKKPAPMASPKPKPSPTSNAPTPPVISTPISVNVTGEVGVSTTANKGNNTKKGKPFPDTDDNMMNVEYPIPNSLLKLENASVKEFKKVDGWIREDITNDDTILIAIYCIFPFIALYGLCCVANSLIALCCCCCIKGEKEKKQPYLPLATNDDEDELMVDGVIDADFEDFMKNGEDVGRQLEMGKVTSRYDRRNYPYSPSPRSSLARDDSHSTLGPDEDIASF